MPELTLAAAVPPDRSRVYFEECAQFPFCARAADFHLINAWWMAEASFAAYENFDDTAAERRIDLTPLSQAGYSITHAAEANTQFLTLENDEALIVAFRGTRLDDWVMPFFQSPGITLNWADVSTDSRFLLRALEPGVLVHEGFLAAYAAIEGRLALIMDKAAQAGKAVWLCGHSLGGALATIAAFKHRASVQGLYTFGSPRVGSGAFGSVLTASLGNIYRFVHHRDAVPTLPPEGLPLTSESTGWRQILATIQDRRMSGYAHVGRLKYITGRETWEIQDESGPLNTLSGLTEDAVAFTQEVAQVIMRRFSLSKPASWPVLLRAIADHSPMYYTNKIFNAHEAVIGQENLAGG